jgi:hypothetical protein
VVFLEENAGNQMKCAQCGVTFLKPRLCLNCVSDLSQGTCKTASVVEERRCIVDSDSLVIERETFEGLPFEEFVSHVRAHVAEVAECRVMRLYPDEYDKFRGWKPGTSQSSKSLSEMKIKALARGFTE